MPFVVADRVKETTISVGTGALALAGAVLGFRSFSSVTADGDTVYYAIIHSAAGDWEVGYGTRNAGPILTRTAVIASSNANAPVDFGAGTKEVFLTFPAAASNQQLTSKWVVDFGKDVGGATRDGSPTFPFASMTDALAAWKAGGCVGVVEVVSVNAAVAWDFPAPDVNPSFLRIAGVGPQTNSLYLGRTSIGTPNGGIDLVATGLELSFQNIQSDNWSFVDAGLLAITSHNSRFGALVLPDMGIVDSYFYDSAFASMTFTDNALSPHFHNCLMGDVTLGQLGAKVFVVSPTNRPTSHGSAQSFTIAWPGVDAGNKAFLDGVANYLRTGGDLILTNGTHTLMA